MTLVEWKVLFHAHCAEQTAARLAAVEEGAPRRLDSYVKHSGELTLAGKDRIERLISDLRGLLVGHDDNCGPGCRIDLRNHDCCAQCNQMQDIVALAARQDAEADAWDAYYTAGGEWSKANPRPSE